MKWIKFLLVLLVTGALTFFLNRSLSIGEQNLPALGPLLSPFTGFWQNGAFASAQEDATLKVEGLLGEVTIAYDDRMVPHIYADNLQDLYFAQGYAEAKHRLWQMDMVARSTGGRLSEVLGPSLLERDKMQRKKGLRWSAQRALEAWETHTYEMEMLEAYIDGVNTYIESLTPATYPLEYKLIGFAPEPWTALKSALVAKSMALTLCSREDDIKSTNTLGLVGQEQYDFLFPNYNPKQRPIIPSGTLFQPQSFDTLNLPEGIPESYGQLPPIKDPKFTYPEEGIGSNNWAISGSKTASGATMLCNDPHLNLTLPSIWHEVHLHSPDCNVYGVSLLGIPAVIIGFNEQVAWGITNSSHDVADWYQIQWADQEHSSYIYDGETLPVEYLIDTIYIKGQSPEIQKTPLTVMGPVVYQDKEEQSGAMVLRWVAHDKPKYFELKTFIKLNQANNYQDYREALTFFSNPAQNFVFASREGDIAITVNGTLPLRNLEVREGEFVRPITEPEMIWQDYIPFEDNPHVKNPPQGWVGSANQRSTDSTYPYYYHGHFDDYRGRILDRLLNQMDSVTIPQMMAMQNNRYSILAEEALPLLLKNLNTNQFNTIQQGMVKILQDWDYDFQADATGPVLFHEWWTAFNELVWDEFDPQEAVEYRTPEAWRTIELLQDHPALAYWDLRETETREDLSAITTQAFIKMFEKIKPHLDDGSYNWGKHWSLNINHLARIDAFSRQDIEVGGYNQALNAMNRVNGPSWRMIVEFTEPMKAYGIYPGGQVGTPGHPFYDHMITPWSKGEYFPLHLWATPEEGGEQILYTLTLK